MKKQLLNTFILLGAILFLSVTVMEFEAEARFGGGRSMGSRGSRSYSRPATPSRQYAPSNNQQRPQSNGYQQPASGGFLRSMAGGIAGGLLGGMLFRSLGFGGMGGGGGIGMFEIILLAGIGYMIYSFLKKKRERASIQQAQSEPYRNDNVISISRTNNIQPQYDDLETGLSHIRQCDSSFDENSYNDLVMDNFFKIQSAWMNRDLTSVKGLLTDEMLHIFQTDLNKLITDKQINRLENIAVRKVNI
ncbi:MAG: TIM44-like domain-containing protein, partial [Desulfuromonadaceae bacterium]|nr:TIM44-like domain-containing protein [Desulfuromonadaceae bacterium]